MYCRGLRTALIEREDFAAGTSSRSTKLVHGGVRYLEKAVFSLDYGQLKLVFEALHERKRLLENAPHLCNALPIMTVSSALLTAASLSKCNPSRSILCHGFAAMLLLVGGAILLAWPQGVSLSDSQSHICLELM